MGDFLSGIGDFLGGIAADAIAAVVQVAQWLYSLVVYVATVLANWIETLAAAVFSVLKSIGAFFQHIWDNFFKGLWKRLLKTLKASQVWDDLRHGHLLKFLVDLRALLNTLFNQFLRPILVMLQHVRQFLLILKLLHIGFAAKLDQWISQTEARIVQAFTTITATVNVLTDITNALMDPTYLLRKPALLLSLRRQIPALIRVMTGKPPGYWFPSPKGKAGGAFAPVGSGFVASDPAQNPLASSFIALNDGVPDSLPLDIGYTISTTAVDSAAPLDFFNDALYPVSTCSDPRQCIQTAVNLAVATVKAS